MPDTEGWRRVGLNPGREFRGLREAETSAPDHSATDATGKLPLRIMKFGGTEDIYARETENPQNPEANAAKTVLRKRATLTPRSPIAISSRTTSNLPPSRG